MVSPICASLDEAMAALASFDVCRLEAVERELQLKRFDGASIAPELFPEIFEKHARLGQLLAATAANLRVLASVSGVASTTESKREHC